MAIIKLCYGSSLPDPSQFLEKISEQINTQSENKQTKVSETQNSKENIEVALHIAVQASRSSRYAAVYAVT